MNVSPYTYQSQVYAWPGKIKVVEFSLPPMNQTEAQSWIAFFNSLNGFENTFTVDLSIAYPNEAGSDSVEMRLLSPEQVWDISADYTYGFSFSAMEVKS